MFKKNRQFSKSHMPNWSSTKHEIVAIKQHQYLIPRINKQTLYLRHAVLKV